MCTQGLCHPFLAQSQPCDVARGLLFFFCVSVTWPESWDTSNPQEDRRVKSHQRHEKLVQGGHYKLMMSQKWHMQHMHKGPITSIRKPLLVPSCTYVWLRTQRVYCTCSLIMSGGSMIYDMIIFKQIKLNNDNNYNNNNNHNHDGNKSNNDSNVWIYIYTYARNVYIYTYMYI